MVRILLVDDQIILRAGLKAIINESDRYKIVGEARNGIQALEIMRSEEVDVVLTDIKMPEMNGIECTRSIVKNYPNTKVIAITMHMESEYVKIMLDVGASGYLLKDASEVIIKEAIDSVHAGTNYFGNEIEKVLLNDMSESTYFKLSQRELDVLKLILKEKSNSEIANELFISIRTVDAHRRNLLKKTGSKNTVGLTKYALKCQLI